MAFLDVERFDVTVVVASGRSAGTSTSWRVENDRVVALDATASDPALTITVAPSDLPLLLSGDMSPAAAYMQGKLKPAGDNELWLKLAKASASAEYDAWRSAAVASASN